MRRNRFLRSQGSDEEKYGSPAWMTTYGDMVTLLLTFFVLLFAFSSIDVQRFQEIMSAIQHSFMGRTGILMGTTELGSEAGERMDVAELTAKELAVNLGEREMALLEMVAEMEEIYMEVQAFLREAGLEGEVQLRWEERGIVMELPERFLFDTGRAEIKPEFLPTLDLLAELLTGLKNQIIVEGHTDNVPISTFLYPSNWELSVARAVSVTRYLVEGHGLNPKRFVATGYGEHHPIDTNETSEGRARNRRVTIVISMLKVENNLERE